MKYAFSLLFAFFIISISSAQVPPATDQRHYDIVSAVSADRIEQDIKRLVSFGTRHTLSDTTSKKRGIGAARRWIKSEFDNISKDCKSCLEVSFMRDIVKGDPETRIKKDVEIVNVVAIQRGSKYPNRYVIMSGDIDSRVTDVMNAKSDAPGANDNASGMAGVIEAARVLSKYQFESSIIYVGLSGEEQGLFGGKIMAEYAKAHDWDIIGVLNNDMIGNIQGINQVIDNRSFRIFSEPTPVTEDERTRTMRRYYGGEVDGVSRQLARYIDRMTNTYMPEMKPMMIYRLDRFGRGGHHKPFNDAGFPGVRIMETNENYTWQHQDVRTEDGVAYGDVIEHVNFPYAAKLTAVNAITLAGLAWAPPAPDNVEIAGAVQASTSLRWEKTDDESLAGYKIYWRETTEAQWQYSKFVGDVSEYLLENVVIDNYFFGVAAVAKDGNESVVVFPGGVYRRE
ncbi:M28 family metallopeptidase [Fulvivirga maritima]|uniref:M28 family peptidase n=1 Tax=Fulvivirga maritima TaxID=2904247 RepID=UPI001F436CD4|nr:M28 family metallopeptidase [Fulvivirga maritima]UII27365.1 M28 family metallopeptidase [Fulvivirga maritima]